MGIFGGLFRSQVDRILLRGSDEVLHRWLKANRVFVPARPLRMLDARTFSPDDLQALLKEEAERLARVEVDGFQPWVVNGEFLPVFVDARGRDAFTRKVSKDLGKVFAAGCIQVNLFASGVIAQVPKIVIQPFLDTERTIEVVRKGVQAAGAAASPASAASGPPAATA